MMVNPVVEDIDGHNNELQSNNPVYEEITLPIDHEPDGVLPEVPAQSNPQPSQVNHTCLRQEQSEPDGSTQSSTISCESTQTLHSS